MTARSGTIASTAPATGLAAGAVVAGAAASLFGVVAFLTVVIGDDLIAFDAPAVVAVTLAALGGVATAIVGTAPGAAAIGMSTATVGYVIALADKLGAWWSAYQAAIATSGAAENAFWSEEPAMGLFVVSGVLFAFGAVLAALRWDSVTPQPSTALEE